MKVEEMTYKQHGFQLFPKVLDGVGLRAIQEWFLHRLYEMSFREDFGKGDSQVPSRLPFGRCSMGESLLHAIQPIIEQAVGEELLPTYSYPVVYLPGSVLKRHVDRDACEFTATLTIYNEPEGMVWPIYAESLEKKDLTFNLNPGDLCFYDGRNRDHWRDALPNDQYNVSIFLHYVKKHGIFSTWSEREQLPGYQWRSVAELVKPVIDNK